MPDFMDPVQERTQEDNDAAVAALLSGRPAPSRVCICGCGEPVEPARFESGACRTLECQRAWEAEQRRFGRR